jgi:hypothetical protein
MRRAASWTLLLASSLLLAGCDIPRSLEDLLQWREKFLLPLTLDQVQLYLGLVLALILTIVTVRTLVNIPREMNQEMPFQYTHAAWWFGMALGIILVYLLVEIANVITQKVLTTNITIDSVLANLHLVLTIDPLTMVIQVWAINLSGLLPIFIAGAILFDLLITTIALGYGALWRSTKAVWIVPSVWLGHFLFLEIFKMVQAVLGELYPAWEIIPVGSAISGIYIWIVVVFGVFCYLIIPLGSFIAGPELVGDRAIPHTNTTQGEERTGENHEHHHGEAPPIVVPIPVPTPREEEPEERPIDASWKPLPSGDIILGLPPGDIPPEDNPPGPPEGNPPGDHDGPQYKNPPDPRNDPDWVPPTNRNTPPDPPVIVLENPKTPVSQKITKHKTGVNKIENIVKVILGLTGQPEAAAAVKTLQTTTNTVMDAAVKVAKTRERKKIENPDWVPPLTPPEKEKGGEK